MLFEEEDVKTRKEVIRVANKIIRELRETGEEYTIVWGTKDSIEYIKQWKNKKYKPTKKTPKEVNKDIVNILRNKFDLGEPI